MKDAVLGSEVKGRHLYRVRANDFIYNRLFAWKGSFGVIPEAMGGCFVSNEFPVFVTDPTKVDPEFIWRFCSLPQVWRSAEDKSSGSTRTSRLRFKEEDLLKLRILLPPLAEQHAITHVLRTVQQAKEVTAQVIAAARQLKQSLMRHLFTYGPVPFDQADRVPLKETEIGPVPEHWEIVRLGDFARIGNGSTPKRTNESYWQDGTIPWLTSGKVHERIIRQADEFVTEKARQECHLPVVKKGSVVVAITGQGKTLGNAALVDFDTCVSQHLAYIQPQKEIHTPFVLAFLHQRYSHRRQISSAGGSTKGALTCAFLKAYPMPHPPLEQQYKIASMIEAVEQKLKSEEARLQALDTLFQTLLHDLMTGKVRIHDVPAFARARGEA
jgi:type I restriction enzyme S subunit